MFGFFKRRRRRKIRKRAFPAAWSAILRDHLPYIELLEDEERRSLQELIQVFLDEKEFEGLRGQVIDDEVRVMIAAQACLLLLGRESDFYPDLQKILVYPKTYVEDGIDYLPDGTVVEGPETRLGESWHRGSVVLAWDTVLADAQDIYDGHNVVMHEFAHQLDNEISSMDGAPLLDDRKAYGPWASILGAEFEALQEAVDDRDRTTIDPYGATNPAEFFAVVTETFFEKPRQLRAKHPKLYEQFEIFYRQDPARRFRDALDD